MTTHGTTIATWAGAIAAALQARRIDSKKVFDSVGLNIQHTTDPQARFAVPDMTALWRACVDITANPAFGLSVPNYLTLTSFHGLGPALEATGDMQTYLERVIKFSPLVSNVAEMKCYRKQLGNWVLQWHIPPLVRGEVAHEAMDAFLATFCRQCMPKDLTDVYLIRPKPKDPSPWYKLFNCPVHFSADMDAVVFPQAVLNKTLGIDNPVLASACDEVSLQYLRRLQRSSLVLLVETQILHQLECGEPKQQAVADALCLSVRQLQRRLSTYKTSFAKLLKKSRHHLARQYLANNQYSITEISLRLGFNDPSNFATAFRRWEGISPSRYRERWANRHSKVTFLK